MQYRLVNFVFYERKLSVPMVRLISSMLHSVQSHFPRSSAQVELAQNTSTNPKAILARVDIIFPPLVDYARGKFFCPGLIGFVEPPNLLLQILSLIAGDFALVLLLARHQR